MSQSLADAEFWLPPEFLTDNDFLTAKEKNDKGLTEIGGVFGSKFLFPSESSSGFSSNLGSPVESLVGSNETESDEEDYIAGLTRQMAHSTLEDDFSCNNPMFPSDNPKACGLLGSPQSTLRSAGIGCCCRQRSTQNFHSRVSLPAAAWDLYCAAAEEVARMRMTQESCRYFHGRGLLGPPRKPSHDSVATKNLNLGGGYSTNPSLSYQKVQAIQFRQLKQQQTMKQRQQQLVPSRGRVDTNCRPLGLSPAAWPSLEHAYQQQRTDPAMRAMFLGNPAGKKECAGTGVFLPRRVNTSTTSTEIRKKPAMSAVLVPAKVVQALKLDSEPGFHLDNEGSLRVRNSNLYGDQKRSFRPEKSVTNELLLPQEWSY